MDKLFLRTLLLWPWVGAVLTATCFGVQSWPHGWWLHDSPEEVLAKVQATNQNLTFFYAEKVGRTSTPITNPFAKTNGNERTDFFQRRSSDGSVETKEVRVTAKFQSTDYKLKSGHYYSAFGHIIKEEFAEGDDLEMPIAGKFDHPYDFKILKSEMVGTNDCIVLRRSMTPKFLDTIKAIYYKDYTKEQEAEFGGDFRKFIRSETDYYFRKSDGASFGQISRNHLGEELENGVYDKVEINHPIPEQEFFLPQGDIKTAKSNEEFMQIFGQLLRAAKRAKAQ
jgi:hypothetical protein